MSSLSPPSEVGPRASRSSAPEPGATAADILCPMCGYDLRGLVEPRCPECGFRFNWAELTDPSKRLHPYLFEHHPEKNVRSFVRTLIGGLWPARFWAKLHPSQPSRPGRLAVYAAVVMLVLLSPVPVALVSDIYSERVYQSQARAGALAWTLSAAGKRELHQVRMARADYLKRYFPHRSRSEIIASVWRNERWNANEAAEWLLVPVGWGCLTVAAFAVLPVTLRRARARPVHLVRCVVYSLDVAVWPALVFDTAIAWQVVRTTFSLSTWLPWCGVATLESRASFLALLGVVVVSAWRFAVAVRRYLRLEWPLATALLVQAMALLALLVLLSNSRLWLSLGVFRW